MYVIIKIIISAFIGTTLMTMFSYGLTYIFKTHFKEPVILYKLLRNSAWIEDDSINTFAGWLLHYGAGIGFVIVYYSVWNFGGVAITYLNGAILGLISGFFGVGIWWIIFKIHRNPPFINLNHYFLHLIVVHIIFGIGATAGYLMVR